jgi:hypothetical protein
MLSNLNVSNDLLCPEIQSVRLVDIIDWYQTMQRMASLDDQTMEPVQVRRLVTQLRGVAFLRRGHLLSSQISISKI